AAAASLSQRRLDRRLAAADPRRVRRASGARDRDLPGLQTIAVGAEGVTLEVAVVEYEGGDRLNVPLYRIDQLEPYRTACDGAAPPPRLHRLGARTWQRQRDKTRAAIRAMAAELLDLYARRQPAL